MIKWFKGEPAHAGWWVTRLDRFTLELWRWWDGARWSVGSADLSGHVFCKSASIESTAAIPAITQTYEWSTYYPDKPTIPRLDPTGLTQGEIDWFYDIAPTMQAAANLGLRIQCSKAGEDWREWVGNETLCHPRYDWRYFVAANMLYEFQG